MFTYQTCLCVKWIIKQVKFTGKLLVVLPLQVQGVLISTESIVWGKLYSKREQTTQSYIQGFARCRRARDCFQALSLPHSAHQPQSGNFETLALGDVRKKVCAKLLIFSIVIV